MSSPVTLGQTDIKITPLIIGTWQAGKRGWVDIQDQDIIIAIQTALEQGITTIDTAEIYGDGYSEELVSKAIKNYRGQAVIATKVFANHLAYDQVLLACENSLKRLQVDVIDLYQIHWPSGTWNSALVPIAETMQALVKLQEQGKIRAIGVSNFSLAQVKEAQQYGVISSIQPPYSLFWRVPEQELIPYCVQQGISVLAYSSLAQGLLTGKFTLDHQFSPEDVRSKNILFQGELYQQAQVALAQMRPIAEAYHVSLGNLALAWLLHQPQSHAIIGVRHREQVLGNLPAVTLRLSAETLAEMDQISQPVNDLIPADALLWNF
ncbi:aldo/keto reductase [Gloeomargarita lithophora Alchichica-D10]|uniref:Aldo/keto reductase n=1 Tax=Gloeomargarita lithophora Alchichica-D10 TaxID=1188229 RepID=A0A1J0ABP6_9CYAN|nr:aldo/keto reductase [Gloeomargarita lithophora]APB33352.1 aldo/keto reductase [Gloeomargarita lithophora Alchichica-D10]